MTLPTNPIYDPLPRRDDSGAERWAHIIQQASLCGRQLRRLLASQISRWHITDTEFLMLWSCNHASNDGLAQIEVAAMLGVSAAQMSSLVYDLRDRGYVSFERTERDRRRQVLRITGQGRLLLSRILDDLQPLVTHLNGFLSPDEQRQAETLLQRLTDIGNEAGPAEPLDSPLSETTPLRRAS